MEKESGDMAIPKLFYFPNSGSGQDHTTGRRAPAWTILEIPLLLLVTTVLGEVEGVAIEGYYHICSRSGGFCSPSNRLWEKLMLLRMPTTTLRSSLSVAHGSWLMAQNNVNVQHRGTYCDYTSWPANPIL